MHSRARISVNDSNNNSIEANKDCREMASNLPITHISPGDHGNKSFENDGKMSGCGDDGQCSEAEQASPLIVDQHSRTASPVDGKDLLLSRLPPSISPSSSLSLQSSSPTFQAAADTILDRSSSETAHSLRVSTNSHELELSPKSGLSFGIDRILGTSGSKRNRDSPPGELTERKSRVSSATPIFYQDSEGETRSKTYPARHRSISEDSSNCPTTPRSSAASPTEEEPSRDLTHGRPGDSAVLELEGDHTRHRLPSVAAQHGPSCPRPPVDSFHSFPAPAAGHLTRAGYQDIVLGDLTGHAGHTKSIPHNPYHSPGLFLPPPSDICRIEQRR